MNEGAARPTMVGTSLLRLAYASGLFLAPGAMSARGLAATTGGNAYATMTTRAFGAVQANLAVATVRSASARKHERLLIGLNLGCDIGDVLATLLEWRKGELPTFVAIGGSALNGVGAAIWAALLRNGG